ncbi:hypothetical protein QEH52_07970 [Coraliomargarita sp. SDUM461003]|uniref:Lipocalin-like domain-containing protein n=1 Tax=Thalassobacterium maritimum TaxID=3041265 RepID=A0ABU1ATM3_9BACT|nr:hypothetical protein [Coraliomargarita sp. SDUM461003]MDQ8207441.1 hypothetical protein [Coraliomargarita sp. SDUM461003]
MPTYQKLTSTLAILSVTCATYADDTADLSGNWRELRLETPAALIETYYNISTGETRRSSDSQDYAQSGELLVDTYYSSDFATEASSLSIDASGNISGGAAAQILDYNRGRLLAKDDGESLADASPAYVNLAKDIITNSTADSNSQELSIVLRQPASLSLSELDGKWGLGNAYIGSAMQETYYNQSTDNQRHSDISDYAREGERLVDLHRIEDFESNWGTLTINDGSFSGLFSGSISVNGVRPVVAPGDDTSPMTMNINAAKDVIVHVKTEAGEYVELIIISKLPSSLNLAELSGNWRYTSLFIPIEMTESYYNSQTGNSRTGDINDYAGSTGLSEELVDIYYTDEFSTKQGNIHIDSSGNASGAINGSFSIANTENSLLFNDSGDLAPLYINASKNFAYNFSQDTYGVNISLLTKISSDTPETFEESVDLRLVQVDGEAVFTLNGSNDLKIVSSQTLGTAASTWAELSDSEGSSIITRSDAAATSEFYSVTPRTEAE